MAYEKTVWENEQTPLNASNMNKIEQGIYDNSVNLGTKLYKHEITGMTSYPAEVGLVLITDSSTAITTQQQLLTAIQYGKVCILLDGYIDEVINQAFKICDWSGDLTMMGINSSDEIGLHIFSISGSLTDTVTTL